MISLLFFSLLSSNYKHINWHFFHFILPLFFVSFFHKNIHSIFHFAHLNIWKFGCLPFKFIYFYFSTVAISIFINLFQLNYLYICTQVCKHIQNERKYNAEQISLVITYTIDYTSVIFLIRSQFVSLFFLIRTHYTSLKCESRSRHVCISSVTHITDHHMYYLHIFQCIYCTNVFDVHILPM